MKITSQCEKWTCKRSLVPYHRWALSSASSGRGNATQHLKDEASRPSNTRTEISCWNLSRNASADPLAWCVLAVSTVVHTNIRHSLHMIQRSRAFLTVTAQIIHRRHREQHVWRCPGASANPQVRVRVLDELQQLRSHLHGHQPLDAACRAERHHFFPRTVGGRGVGWDPYSQHHDTVHTRRR